METAAASMARHRGDAIEARSELGADERFAGACRWLPLAVGAPFAVMFFVGIFFGWM